MSARAGVGDLVVYFDPAVAMEEKIIFSKYVHEHLFQHARRVSLMPSCLPAFVLLGKR